MSRLFSFSVAMLLTTACVCGGQKTKISREKKIQKERLEALFAATRADNVKDTVRLLAENPSLLNTRSQRNRLSALHVAAFHDSIGVAQLLIEKKARIEATDGSGGTPLHKAALWGSLQVASLLLLHDANIEAQNRDKSTPLYCAAVGVYTRTHSGSKKYSAMAGMLLDQKAQVNCQEKEGNTPLHAAAWENDIGIVARLLDHKADFTITNETQHTPLQKMFTKHHQQIMRGITQLFIAAGEASLPFTDDMLRYLLVEHSKCDRSVKSESDAFCLRKNAAFYYEERANVIAHGSKLIADTLNGVFPKHQAKLTQLIMRYCTVEHFMLPVLVDEVLNKEWLSECD